MAKNRILNWHAKDERLTKGLKHKLSPKQIKKKRSFVTMRLGAKWAKRLKSADVVALSISKDPKEPKIFGYAEVLHVKKIKLADLGKKDNRDYLKRNIGAKTVPQVIKDMSTVYKTTVSLDDDISIIELLPTARKI